MDNYKNYWIARAVLVLVTAVSGLVIFSLLIRKPGHMHDHTRRWVDYTKIGLGLWVSAQIVNPLWQIILFTCFDIVHGWQNNSTARSAFFVISYIGGVIDLWSTIALFLALFYLAHALTQLRTEGQEDSSAYQKGRKVVLGVSGFLCGISIVMWCLFLATSLSEHWDENTGRMYLVASWINTIIVVTLVLCSIGSVVYSAKSRKKALGSPVQKAATILVVCSSLYLLCTAWSVFNLFFRLPAFLVIVDVFTNCWPSFAIFTLLYLLATKEEYLLSKTHYRLWTADDGETG
ncbi:hypothetical protein LZ30DRAFT_251673 [Colletotrichum cereale]|nr:hypothetical protein LZ30DRAFT_251673 [Colletotrichum cereale]